MYKRQVHVVELHDGCDLASLRKRWKHPLTRLSCEIEGHPLGGGMLKVEPREGARILLPRPRFRMSEREREAVEGGIRTMQRWRHYD